MTVDLSQSPALANLYSSNRADRTLSNLSNVAAARANLGLTTSGTIAVGSGGSGPTIYQRLAVAASAAKLANPRTSGVMASPPTIAAGGATLPSGFSNVTTYAAAPSTFQVTGGWPILNTGINMVQIATWTTATTGQGTVGPNGPSLFDASGRIEFRADAAKVLFHLFGQTGAYRFLVNGQYVSLSLNTVAGASNDAYYTLDFTSVGGRAHRTIVVECSNGGGFYSAAVGTTETISRTRGDTIRFIFAGDSYVAGTGTTNAIAGDGFASIMGDLLGIRDLWASGSPGTGYLATDTTLNHLNLLGRLTDITSHAPDIVAIFMGYNDLGNGFSTGQVQAQLTLILQGIRAVLPTIPILVLGVQKAGQPIATVTPYETAIASTVSTYGYTAIAFVPVSTAVQPWQTGTGHVGATAGDGNSDLYIGADGVHPNDSGHAHLAQCCADAVITALATMASAV
jgi:lysophospholipase L1-like esterase